MAVRIDTVASRDKLKPRRESYWQRVRKGCFIGQLRSASGLLGQLIKSVGPALLSSVAGGALGRMFERSAGAGGGLPDATQISASDLSQLTPDQVRELATEAQRQDPGVLDRVGAFYAEHPEVVKVLGGAALAIALGQVATRMRR